MQRARFRHKFLKDLQTKARIFRISRSQLFFKIGVLKNFVIFIGKTLCWSLFLITLQALKGHAFLKKPVAESTLTLNLIGAPSIKLGYQHKTKNRRICPLKYKSLTSLLNYFLSYWSFKNPAP